MPPRRRKPRTVNYPHTLRDHPSLSDSTLVMTMEDMIHATFGSEEANRVDFKLFETVLTILGRRLNLLDQKVSIVEIDIDQEKVVPEEIHLFTPHGTIPEHRKSETKEQATVTLMVFLSKLHGQITKKFSSEKNPCIDTASFLDLIDHDSKIKLFNLIENVEGKSEGKFLIEEYLKPFLDNLWGFSDSSAVTVDLDDTSLKLDEDSKQKSMSRAFEKEFYVLGSEVSEVPGRSPTRKGHKKSIIEEEALAILGLLRKTFTFKKKRKIRLTKPPGMDTPSGWPESLPWPPTPGTVWPAGANWPPGTEPPPPIGWPKDLPWPPLPGTMWPFGVSWPTTAAPPLNWPLEATWYPPPGTAWPTGVFWPIGNEPPRPEGWPANAPWPPKPGSVWPPGVSCNPGVAPPSGWPADLPWPPPPGSAWPKGASWPPGMAPPAPQGWPPELPWPPSPGTKWPSGVFMYQGIPPPQGWPAGLAWPPPPGTAWPYGVSWLPGLEPPPPHGWPQGTPWPPPPGMAWPSGVSMLPGVQPPKGWPATLDWAPSPGTPWPADMSWPPGEEPPRPQGWPAGLPWPPQPGAEWPTGVSVLPGIPPPQGWPAGLPFPPLPGTAWPLGVYWPSGKEPPPPPGWPPELPWPPTPGMSWPFGVSLPQNILPPNGWPADLPWPPPAGTLWPRAVAWPAGAVPPAPQGWPSGLPWPPTPGTAWPNGVSWPYMAPSKRRSSLQLTDEGDTIVAHRVPSKTGSKTSTKVGTVECVTVSQFEILKKAVHDLQKISAPIPMPTMPVNKKLLKEVSQGSASLTDTMEAMKVVSRVQAMEDAVGRLSEMVSALASGLGTKMPPPDTDLKVVKPSRSPTMMEVPSPQYQMAPGTEKPSAVSIEIPCVTKPELANALAMIREQLGGEIEEMRVKVTGSAETSIAQGKMIMAKMEEVVNISHRINSLQDVVAEYYHQLEGLDSGITVQIRTFNEQMQLLKNDLQSGLELLANVNSNKETMAVMDLTERYEGLLGDLDGLLHLHSQLDQKQRDIADELRQLVHAVERVSEQKADHDELADGLKDKADQSTLSGLLTEENFLKAMEAIKRKLEACYDKFSNQEAVWHEAINDVMGMIDQKADYAQVFSWKDHTLEELRNLHCQVKLLALAVGEPKAALLARQMAKDAFCGACAEVAFMDVVDTKLVEGEALSPQSAACIASYKQLFKKEEDRRHLCKRWVGGSHTMMTPGVVVRGRAETPPGSRPLKPYLEMGNDGKLYRCVAEMKPCEECNVQHTTPRDPQPVGVPAHDSGPKRESHTEDFKEYLPRGGTYIPESVEIFVDHGDTLAYHGDDDDDDRGRSIVGRVKGVNSSLDILATHGKMSGTD